MTHQTNPAAHRVTILGTGRIGTALARRWLAAGWDVVVWNRTAANSSHLHSEGARVESDLGRAVASAAVVVSVLSDGASLLSTLQGGGGLAAMASGSLLLDLSTIDLASSTRIAKAAAERGVRFVRGAISGSPALVEAGRSSALLSGAGDDLEEATQLLAPVVAGVTVVGHHEEAKAVKLAINAMVGSAVVALAEAMVTVDASGVSRDAFVAALEKSAIWSPVVAYKAVAMRDHDHRITATTGDLLKDVQLAVDLQTSVGVQSMVSSAILDALHRTVALGYRDDDCITVASALQLASGREPDVKAVAARLDPFGRDGAG